MTKPPQKSEFASLPANIKEMFLRYEAGEEQIQFQDTQSAQQFVEQCNEVFQGSLENHAGTLWTTCRVPLSRPYTKRGVRYSSRILRITNPTKTKRNEPGYFPTETVTIKFVRY